MIEKQVTQVNQGTIRKIANFFFKRNGKGQDEFASVKGFSAATEKKIAIGVLYDNNIRLNNISISDILDALKRNTAIDTIKAGQIRYSHRPIKDIVEHCEFQLLHANIIATYGNEAEMVVALKYIDYAPAYDVIARGVLKPDSENEFIGGLKSKDKIERAMEGASPAASVNGLEILAKNYLETGASPKEIAVLLEKVLHLPAAAKILAHALASQHLTSTEWQMKKNLGIIFPELSKDGELQGMQ